MAAGLTPLGFVPKTVLEIIAELQSEQRSTVDGSLNSSGTGVLANINMSIAMQLGQVWELLGEIYDAHDPDTAEGIAADHNGSLRGITRKPATKAQTTLRLTLAAHTTVPTGSVVSDPTRPTVRFVTTADASTTLAGGDVNVGAEAETAGLLTAGANTLTKIESLVSGWSAVANPGPAIPGTDVESDEAYRLRQQALGATTQGSTLDGIIADVRLLPLVVSAVGYENVEDITINGLPPHSFEIVASGGSDTMIAESIWSNKPAGIETYGNLEVSIVDSEGNPQLVRFSRPVVRVVNVNYSATVDGSYTSNAIRLALELASVNPASPMCFIVGQPVYIVRMLAVASEVQGVVNVTLDADFAPAMPPDAVPSSPSNILAIGMREVATFAGASWVGT